jgi:hypothetical protein
VSVGAILFLDGLLIYTFFQVDEHINTLNSTLDLNIRCTDVLSNITSVEGTDINGVQKYIPIEFAGLLESVAFYVRTGHWWIQGALRVLQNFAASAVPAKLSGCGWSLCKNSHFLISESTR